MTAAVATPKATARHFANDGSLASVEAMLRKQASIYYPRVLALGLPMEFEDVLQELMVAYVKARKGWTPEKAKFNTYCYTVARNHFNRAIERMVLDRDKLGMSSIDDYLASQEDPDDRGDGYERFFSEDADEGAEANMVARDAMRERLSRLTPACKRLVLLLLKNEQDKNAPAVSLKDMAKHLGLQGDDLFAVQVEIKRVFGVEVNFGLRRRMPE